MSALTFNESLITIIDNAQTSADVETQMADMLCEQGYVKDTYRSALLEREKNFPTGLDVQGINAAIPHCDVQYVNEGALCVGILKTPVTWHRMEDAAATTEVGIVVMLALTDPTSHLTVLRSVIKLIQDQELIARVVACSTAVDAYELLKDRFAL